MNASAILRKLLDLDKLEGRIKQMKEPSKALLEQIAQERAKLMKGEDATTQSQTR